MDKQTVASFLQEFAKELEKQQKLLEQKLQAKEQEYYDILGELEFGEYYQLSDGTVEVGYVPSENAFYVLMKRFKEKPWPLYIMSVQVKLNEDYAPQEAKLISLVVKSKGGATRRQSVIPAHIMSWYNNSLQDEAISYAMMTFLKQTDIKQKLENWISLSKEINNLKEAFRSIRPSPYSNWRGNNAEKIAEAGVALEKVFDLDKLQALTA